MTERNLGFYGVWIRGNYGGPHVLGKRPALEHFKSIRMVDKMDVGLWTGGNPIGINPVPPIDDGNYQAGPPTGGPRLRLNY